MTYSPFLRPAEDGRIWWRLEDALKLGAGYLPLRDGAQSCEQIREQIESQSGVLPSVNTTLLRDIPFRQECRFSSAKVYRGDKPIPMEMAKVSQAIDGD